MGSLPLTALISSRYIYREKLKFYISPKSPVCSSSVDWRVYECECRQLNSSEFATFGIGAEGEDREDVCTAGALEDTTFLVRTVVAVTTADSRDCYRARRGAYRGAWIDHLPDSHEEELQQLGFADEGEDASTRTMGGCGDRRRRRTRCSDSARCHLQRRATGDGLHAGRQTDGKGSLGRLEDAANQR
jgi:hypothetical protein